MGDSNPVTVENVGASELDINALCVENPVATYFMRTTGESMVGAGVFNGDLLVVDRSVEPCSGDVVVAELNGSFELLGIKKPLTFLSAAFTFNVDCLS